MSSSLCLTWISFSASDVEIHLALLGLFLGTLLVFGLLEGIDHELVIGRLLLRWLQEQGLGMGDLGFFYDNLVLEQSDQLEIDGYFADFEHLALFAVFNLYTIETDLLGEGADADAVDLHLGL